MGSLQKVGTKRFRLRTKRAGLGVSANRDWTGTMSTSQFQRESIIYLLNTCQPVFCSWLRLLPNLPCCTQADEARFEQRRQSPAIEKVSPQRWGLRRKTIIYNLKAAPEPDWDAGFSTMKHYGSWLTRAANQTPLNSGRTLADPCKYRSRAK